MPRLGYRGKAANDRESDVGVWREQQAQIDGWSRLAGSMAAAAAFALPAAMFFLVVQRCLVAGMTRGALEG